jgi:hypothetical protein
MSPRLRHALGRGAISGLTFGAPVPIIRLVMHEQTKEALKDAAATAAAAFLTVFLVASLTTFFFPSFGQRRARPPQSPN